MINFLRRLFGRDPKTRRWTRIRELSRWLAQPRTAETVVREAMSAVVEGKSGAHAEALKELIELALTDPNILYVVEAHAQGLSPRQVLADVFSDLRLAGAGQVVNGYYVPAATLVLVQPLAFALSRRQPTQYGRPALSKREIAVTLIQYFESGDINLIL